MEEGIDLKKLIRGSEIKKPVRCSKCGKVLKYLGIGEYKCESCGYTEYDDYGLVRAYIEKNPGANVVQVEMATGVSKGSLNEMIREGKLAIKNGSTKILEDFDE